MTKYGQFYNRKQYLLFSNWTQPRPQGFSLKGKSPGDEVELDPLFLIREQTWKLEPEILAALIQQSLLVWLRLYQAKHKNI